MKKGLKVSNIRLDMFGALKGTTKSHPAANVRFFPFQEYDIQDCRSASYGRVNDDFWTGLLDILIEGGVNQGIGYIIINQLFLLPIRQAGPSAAARYHMYEEEKTTAPT